MNISKEPYSLQQIRDNGIYVANLGQDSDVTNNNVLKVSNVSDEYYYINPYEKFPNLVYSNSDGFMSNSRDYMMGQFNQNAILSSNNAFDSHYGVYRLWSASTLPARYTVYSLNLIPQCDRDVFIIFDYNTNVANDHVVKFGLIQ